MTDADCRRIKNKKSSEYNIWCAMRRRCYCKTDRAYAYYGGRGISVCNRWRSSFQNFIEDMGRRLTANHSIERRDNDGNYEPANCYWATKTEQARNRRSSRRVTFNGETKCVAEWAEITGLDPLRISSRLRRGWDIEAALATPQSGGKRRTRPGAFTQLACDGKSKSLAEWSQVGGVPVIRIRDRLAKGWNAKRAIFTPTEGSRKRALPGRRKMIEAAGKAMSIAEWSEITGIKPKTIHRRLKLGWVPEAAVGLPDELEAKLEAAR